MKQPVFIFTDSPGVEASPQSSSAVPLSVAVTLLSDLEVSIGFIADETVGPLEGEDVEVTVALKSKPTGDLLASATAALEGETTDARYVAAWTGAQFDSPALRAALGNKAYVTVVMEIVWEVDGQTSRKAFNVRLNNAWLRPSDVAPDPSNVNAFTWLQDHLDAGTNITLSVVDGKIVIAAAAGDDVDTAVATAINALIASAPSTLNTLDELAAALGDDANFAATVTSSLAARLRFDAVQSLTSPQKAQALSNLGLANATTSAAGLMSSTDKTKLNGLEAGGASIATPSVVYVTALGNDTTGDGTLAKPFATAQKAYDVVSPLSGYTSIHFGVGSFTANVTSWSASVAVDGVGPRQTRLTINSSGPVELRAGCSISVDVYALSTTSGANGPTLTLWGVTGRAARSTGAQGLNGEAGTPESSSGSGYAGGNGGLITLVNCDIEVVESLFGVGGLPGPDAGGGSGNPGVDGANGHVIIAHSDVGVLECETYDWGRSNVQFFNAGTQINDYGANTTMPHRSNFTSLP